MNIEEARLIAAIIAKADNGCSVCVEALIEDCAEAFPQFVWGYREADYELEVLVEEQEGQRAGIHSGD